jgi:uncharacterized protein YndB with AHSA1/START domain
MIRRVVLGLVIALIAMTALAYLFPRMVTVERSTDIAAPPAKVFALLNSYQRFQEWSPWASLDPKARYELAGPKVGTGAILRWSGNDAIGSGMQEIIESVPDRLVTTRITFGDLGPATAGFRLEPSGAGTRITWDLVSDTGYNPIARWMSPLMDGWLGPDFEKGLVQLKALAEKP